MSDQHTCSNGGICVEVPDDRKNRVVSAQATHSRGSSEVGGGIQEQRHATQRVLPESRFELQHTGSPPKETALEREGVSQFPPANDRSADQLSPHRGDYRDQQFADFENPTIQRRAADVQAEIPFQNHALPMQGRVIATLADDRVGDNPVTR